MTCEKGRGSVQVLLGLFIVLAMACVQGEDRTRQTRAADDTVQDAREAVTGRKARTGATSYVDYDTIAAAEYRVFDTTLNSERPKKLTLRLVAMGTASEFEAAKALRSVLDSIAEVDTAVVAARAILYQALQTGPREAQLLPIGFALWLPPEGWDGATEDSRSRLHRTYVYQGAPDWLAGGRLEVPAGGNE